MRAELIYVALALLLAGGCAGGCAREDCSDSMPPAPPADEPLLAAQGYLATRVIEGLIGPTQLQFDRGGRLYVLEGDPGTAKQVRIYGTDFQQVAAIPIDTAGESTGMHVDPEGDQLLIASRGRIDRLRQAGGGWTAEPWIRGLPSGDHTNNGIVRGPDGLVYFTVGSTCDLCDEEDPRSGTVMRVDDGAADPAPEIYARGLRNPYDLAFGPSGTLLATDNGPECCGDQTGCTQPGADRLLEIVRGADYGWPDAYRKNAIPAAGLVAALPVHGGATGITVYDADLLCGDRGSAFLTLWGTQHGRREAGRAVLRVPFGGDITTVLGPSGLRHPIDVTAGPDGALYVLDFGGSVIRLSHDEDVSCP